MAFKVWECKIVVDENAVLPEGFDFPLRRAAINAAEARGAKVITCFSGWGGALTKTETQVVQDRLVSNG